MKWSRVSDYRLLTKETIIWFSAETTQSSLTLEAWERRNQFRSKGTSFTHNMSSNIFDLDVDIGADTSALTLVIYLPQETAD